jgi:hypothetical protein
METKIIVINLVSLLFSVLLKVSQFWCECCLLLYTTTNGKKVPQEFQLEFTFALLAGKDLCPALIILETVLESPDHLQCAWINLEIM